MWLVLSHQEPQTQYKSEIKEKTLSRQESLDGLRISQKSAKTPLFTEFSDGLGGYSLCCGVFHRSLLDGLRFREGKINEDIDFKYKLLERSKRMVVTNLMKYNYFLQEESTSTGGLRINDFQLCEAADLLCELSSKETYVTIAFLGRVKKARTAFSLLSKIAYFGVADSSIDRNTTIKNSAKNIERMLAYC